jgi:L-aminopeptidase/D-esterase-like protein
MLANDAINPLFHAAVDATEEAIINAMVAAKTMTGIDGNTVYALPHSRLQDILRAFNRLLPAKR